MNNTRLTAGTAKVDITTLDESHINDRLYSRILTLCQEDITFVIIALAKILSLDAVELLISSSASSILLWAVSGKLMPDTAATACR